LFKAIRCHRILWKHHTDVHSAGDDVLNVPRLGDSNLYHCGTLDVMNGELRGHHIGVYNANGESGGLRGLINVNPQCGYIMGGISSSG